MLGGDADVEKETSTPHHEFVEAVGNNHSEKENHSITYLITIQLLCEITEPAVEQLPKRNCYTINTKVRMKFRETNFYLLNFSFTVGLKWVLFVVLGLVKGSCKYIISRLYFPRCFAEILPKLETIYS